MNGVVAGIEPTPPVSTTGELSSYSKLPHYELPLTSPFIQSGW